MGAEESKKTGASSQATEGSSSSAENDHFPNMCRKPTDVMAWTLLHQCSLEKWNEGHSGDITLPFIYTVVIKFSANSFRICLEQIFPLLDQSIFIYS